MRYYKSKAFQWVIDHIKLYGIEWVRNNYSKHVEDLGQYAVTEGTYDRDYIPKVLNYLKENEPEMAEKIGEYEMGHLDGRNDNVYVHSDGSVSDHPSVEMEEGKKDGSVSVRSLNITSLQELLEYSKVDLSVWQVERHFLNYWEVTIGAKKSGTGKAETYTNYQVKAILVRRTEESVEDIIADFKDKLSGFSADYPTYERSIDDEGVMVEISVPDFHFGQLSWGEETRGADYDIKIAAKLLRLSILDLLDKIKIYPSIKKIIFPIGNDFFNVNSEANTTVRGTVQHEDDRFKKTFTKGWELVVELVDMMMKIADVDIIVVGGNHDDSRSFFMGELLYAWYKDTDQVQIDRSPSPRKYYLFGNTLIGFVHQYKKTQLKELPYKMAAEAKNMFSQSEYREWHTGHTHAEKIHEVQDCKIITLPSLAPESDWSSREGYAHLREAQAQVYSENNGKIATFSCTATQFDLDSD